MSVLLELVKETRPEDRKAVAEYLKPYLIPEKEEPADNPAKWLKLDEFKNELPVTKDKQWLTTFLLTKPVFKDWVINLNRGKGYKVKVCPLAVNWVKEHTNEINWNESLSRR